MCVCIYDTHTFIIMMGRIIVDDDDDDEDVLNMYHQCNFICFLFVTQKKNDDLI